MPTYQYKCEDCGNYFEKFQSITADPVAACPECEGSVRRLISGGAGFLFKGNGFYITDYRSDHYKQREKAEKSQTSDSKDSSKSDTSKSTSVSTKSDSA